MVVLLSPGFSYAGQREERRIRAGLDLFPTFLAADLDIERKRDPVEELLLVLVYVDRQREAEEMARQLEKTETIRGMPLRVEVTNDLSPSSYARHPAAGIFLTEQLNDGLPSVLRYAETHHVLVFSPFEGDIERGVPAGILISDRILPHVNVKALDAAGIRLKPFFLRIAQRYE
ncbi:MAG: YfiR family protein [bacterium]|nr:YfiR family protein [bacterium]